MKKSNRRKRKMRIIVIFIVAILFVIGIYLVFFNPFLSIKLVGSEKVEIEVGSKYKDKGVKATYFGQDVSKDITKNSISTKKAGKQVIEYKIKKLFTVRTVKRTVVVKEKKEEVKENPKEEIKVEPKYEDNNEINYEGSSGYKEIIMGPKYVNGILIANKKYALPEDYAYGVDNTAYQALENLQAGASSAGFSIPLISGYRSYETQAILYQRYVDRDGQELADTYSARPGHSEHQTGLAFDVGLIDDNYGNTVEGQWLAQNCAEYGFIIRYPKGKEYITGYQYEPWHIRYVGVEAAKDIMSRGVTLEEYLKLV